MQIVTGIASKIPSIVNSFNNTILGDHDCSHSKVKSLLTFVQKTNELGASLNEEEVNHAFRGITAGGWTKDFISSADAQEILRPFWEAHEPKDSLIKIPRLYFQPTFLGDLRKALTKLEKLFSSSTEKSIKGHFARFNSDFHLALKIERAKTERTFKRLEMALENNNAPKDLKKQLTEMKADLLDRIKQLDAEYLDKLVEAFKSEKDRKVKPTRKVKKTANEDAETKIEYKTEQEIRKERYRQTMFRMGALNGSLSVILDAENIDEYQTRIQDKIKALNKSLRLFEVRLAKSPVAALGKVNLANLYQALPNQYRFFANAIKKLIAALKAKASFSVSRYAAEAHVRLAGLEENLGTLSEAIAKKSPNHKQLLHLKSFKDALLPSDIKEFLVSLTSNVKYSGLKKKIEVLSSLLANSRDFIEGIKETPAIILEP